MTSTRAPGKSRFLSVPSLMPRSRATRAIGLPVSRTRRRRCAFLPFAFFALSQLRVALGTVSAAWTDWESITGAVGCGSRPAAADLGAQHVVQPGQRAVMAPGGEAPIYRPPRRGIRGQVPPG